MKQFLLCIILAVMSYSVKSAPINAYAKVTAISGNTLTLSNINQSYHSFAAGEQVLLMQMQDNVIGSNTTNTSGFGIIADIGSAGLYRVYTISSISGTTMTLTTAVSPQFNAAASMQVVSYNNLGTNYTVSSSITAVPWDGNIGGVVALQVSGTLTVNAGITADEAGFRGGNASTNASGSCEPTTYMSLSNNYGKKAEGVQYATNGSYSSRAALANGGGGGSLNNAGGGGGGNYTGGGLGGAGNGCSAANASGGLGGATLNTYVTGSRFFMGGGGGGGQQNNGNGSDGAAGGGIVIISADKISTSCFLSVITISAEGGTADDSGNDGAGGAGAGGTVVLNVNSYSPGLFCPLVLAADGGDGGDVANTTAYGGGGGGGQGALVFTASLPTQVYSQTDNGNGGDNGGFFGGTSAGDGQGTNNAGVLVGYAITLPVELLSFTVEKDGQQDLLKWSTAQGPQPAKFTIQRSGDGSTFTDIGTVAGSPDVSNGINYSYKDALPLAGKNFYRVRAGDVTGESKYTPVVLISRDEEGGAFHIFPNPAHDNFTIQLPEATNDVVSVTVNDLSGATIYRAELQAANGRIAVANLGSIVPGAYLVRVETKAGVQSGKLILR